MTDEETELLVNGIYDAGWDCYPIDPHGWNTDEQDREFKAIIRAVLTKVRDAEREACARICNEQIAHVSKLPGNAEWSQEDVAEQLAEVRDATAREAAELCDRAREESQRNEDRLMKLAQHRYNIGGRSAAEELKRQAFTAESVSVACAGLASSIRARFGLDPQPKEGAPRDE